MCIRDRYVEFAKAIRDYAPRAWVINYTNPMSLCVKTLYHVFPQIKAFGCCHEVFGTQKVLKGLLEDTMGLKGINRKDIRVNVLGINHFTWFDYASYEGIDPVSYTHLARGYGNLLGYEKAPFGRKIQSGEHSPVRCGARPIGLIRLPRKLA